jgi:hypothetical protein
VSKQFETVFEFLANTVVVLCNAGRLKQPNNQLRNQLASKT